MKKFLFYAMMAFMVIGAQSTVGVTEGNAQVITLPLAAGDTTTDAGTAYKTFTLTGGYSGVTVQANVRKLSGTVGGTVGLYISLDGTNYALYGSAQTVTNTTGTKPYTWSFAAPVPYYMKVLHTGTGTMSSVLTVIYEPTYYQPPR